MKTKHSLIENIRKEVIKANPSILDLVFGCKVFVQNYVTSVTIIEDKRGHVRVEETQYVLDFVGFASRSESLVQFDEKHITKILGRTIGIADVLLAIGDEPVNFFYYSTGEVRMDYLDKDDKEISIYWNLKNDNLELQPEETLLFINNLLTQ